MLYCLCVLNLILKLVIIIYIVKKSIIALCQLSVCLNQELIKCGQLLFTCYQFEQNFFLNI